MLKFIPADEQTKYKENLKQQLSDLQQKGLTYTLDNLKACGLRILDEEPDESTINDILERNAYLFIINQQTGECSLGFKDSQTGIYKQCPLDSSSNLKNHVNEIQEPLNDNRNIHQLSHCVIHDHFILELARNEIKQFGGQTEITETTHSHNLQPLLSALKIYEDNYDHWTEQQKTEHWCVIVGWAQRSLPAAVWNWWMHPDINWCDISESDFHRSFPARFRPKDSDNSFLLPLSCFLGDRHAVGGMADARYIDKGRFAFLNLLVEAKTQKLDLLFETLAITQPTNNL